MRVRVRLRLRGRVRGRVRVRVRGRHHGGPQLAVVTQQHHLAAAVDHRH